MSDLLLAEFDTARAATEAVKKASEAGHPPQDILSNIPLEDVAERLEPQLGRKPIGWVMFIAGALGAISGYFMQWIGAAVLYPTNSGGRPLNSWPAFMPVPYELAILSAAIVGVLAWMWMCGLTKLFHPLFAAPAVERAAQDTYLLVFPRSQSAERWIRSQLRSSHIHELRE